MQSLNHFKFSNWQWRVIHCLFVFIFCSIILRSEETIVITPNPDFAITVVNRLKTCADENQKYTLQSILYDSSINYDVNPALVPKGHTYWSAFSIANLSDQDENLWFGSNYWDYVTTYIVSDKKILDTLQFGILTNKYDNQFFIKSGLKVDIISRFHSIGKFRREPNINLVIYKMQVKYNELNFTQYMDGIVFGILFGLTLYNFFLFISLKDKSYLLYTLYIVFIQIGFITIFQNSPPKVTEYVWPRFPYISFWVKKAIDTFNPFVFLLFTSSFLKTYEYFPKWDRILKWSVLLLVLLQMFLQYNEIINFGSTGRILLGTTVRFTCFGMAVYFYLIGHKKVGTFLIGCAIIQLGDQIAIWQYQNVDILSFLPHTPIINYFRTYNAFFVCGAIESIVFSFALAGKYNGFQKDIIKIQLEKEKEKQEMLASQNATLEKQVQERTHELSRSLQNLTATQSQLIHSEKMASLGELTSGIAHEIQNPLNFINNFSELNMELLSGLEIPKYESEIQLLKKNSDKILHHGHRIDGIVKGMLQHSRHSDDIKELVDISKLCEESLALAFQAYRAKDKRFDAVFMSQYDTKNDKLEVVPQEISRALLNIINNAFYACTEKSKKYELENIASDLTFNFQGVVKLTTVNSIPCVRIVISDNGIGISESAKAKIFQPFYTTKPTGEGTGLGLSIAYDIITKGHGGEINVRSRLGEGTEFEIVLPRINNHMKDHSSDPILISKSSIVLSIMMLIWYSDLFNNII